MGFHDAVSVAGCGALQGRSGVRLAGLTCHEVTSGSMIPSPGSGSLKVWVFMMLFQSQAAVHCRAALMRTWLG